jgi:hypothetical protein
MVRRANGFLCELRPLYPSLLRIQLRNVVLVGGVSVFPWNQLNQDFKIRYIPGMIELGEDSLMPHLRLLTVC